MHGSIKARIGCRAVRGCVRLRSERGAALIEIMMAALVVALAATAVFKGIEGAFAVSSGSKSRAIAASLAQDDQERLRATTPANLPNLDQNRAVRRGEVTYTVRSTARWISDRQTRGCTTAVSRAGYLRITSTVTWPDMRGSRPVTATSILAPANGTVTIDKGAIGIKVLDGATPPHPVPGASVSVSGLGLTGTTDADGCVFWDELAPGNYNYTASKAGYVDYHGYTSVTRPISVAAGQTRIDTIFLDNPTGLSVAVKTKGYDGVEHTGYVDTAVDQLFLANSKMSALNGVRNWSLSSDTASVSQLFPMQYGVYVGPCSFENNSANYAGTPTGTGVFSPPFPAVPPGQPLAIYKPMIKLRARYNNGTTGDNTADVRIVQQLQPNGQCAKDYGFVYGTPTTPSLATVSDGVATTDDSGRIPDVSATVRRGFPYGEYRVCAESNRGGLSSWRHSGSQTVILNNLDGVAVDLNMTNASNNGHCPATL